MNKIIELENLYENVQNSNLIPLYHGGRKWMVSNAVVHSPKNGRYEAGAGIYLTNNYETASKYAKGSNVVSIVYIENTVRLTDNILVSIDELVDFIKTNIGFKNRKHFINDFQRWVERTNNSNIPVYVLNNLGVNYEIGGSQMLRINNFMVEHGADVSIHNSSIDDEWVVVHNPKVIKKIVHTKPNDINLDDLVLPKASTLIKT